MKQPQSHRRFHDHLDVCRQCRNRPFDLCPTGDRLLRATADDDAIDFMGKAYGTLPNKSEGQK
jgi:hypothetical protein